MVLAYQCLALQFYKKIIKNAIFTDFNPFLSRKPDVGERFVMKRLDFRAKNAGPILFAQRKSKYAKLGNN